MRHLRHLQDAAVDLAVSVFDGAERLHWRMARARTAVLAPIAGAFARRSRVGRAERPRPDRVRIGILPRVLAGAVGLFAIVAISTALAPSSSSEAVPRTEVGVAPKTASKPNADGRIVRRSASATPSRDVQPTRAPVAAPRNVTAPTKPRLVAHRVVVKGARATRAQRPRTPAPVTTPPPPAPQPVAPAPQPPTPNDPDEEPPDGDNSGPGGGEDEGDGGGKDKDEKDKDKDKDKEDDEDKDESEEDAPEPPPPPDDEDDD